MSVEAAGLSPMERLVPEVNHYIKMLDPLSVSGSSSNPVKLGWNELALSTYMVFFIIALILVVAIVFWAKKRMTASPVPKGRAINAFELLVDFVRNNIVGGCIKHDGEKYTPFILTVFFFILVSNVVGLIPGCKPSTGTIGATFALAMIVFVYFTVVGIAKKGGFGYIKALVPRGLPKAVVPLIFVIEFASMLLRPITLGLRLFANMYAGHIILGIFAILTELFILAPFEHQGVLNAVVSPVWFLLLVLMYTLEVAIAGIQAYVFTLLTAVYIDGAIGEH